MREKKSKLGTTIVPNTESRTHLGRDSATVASTESQNAAFAAANAAEEKKAKSTVVLDVRGVTLLADFFVFTGGDSKTQVKAIAQAVQDKLAKQGRKARSVEGLTEARWVLLDFGDLIVHVLHEQERDYYKLEQFWNHALIVNPDEWRDSGNLESKESAES